jgi:DNA-directed RNA polymerase subunit RPC12/RpoP
MTDGAKNAGTFRPPHWRLRGGTHEAARKNPTSGQAITYPRHQRRENVRTMNVACQKCLHRVLRKVRELDGPAATWENRIKEAQGDLFGDRTSTRIMCANQCACGLPLWPMSCSAHL